MSQHRSQCTGYDDWQKREAYSAHQAPTKQVLALIIYDEKLAHKSLHDLLVGVLEVEIVAVCARAEAAICEHQPDLVIHNIAEGRSDWHADYAVNLYSDTTLRLSRNACDYKNAWVHFSEVQWPEK